MTNEAEQQIDETETFPIKYYTLQVQMPIEACPVFLRQHLKFRTLNLNFEGRLTGPKKAAHLMTEGLAERLKQISLPFLSKKFNVDLELQTITNQLELSNQEQYLRIKERIKKDSQDLEKWLQWHHRYSIRKAEKTAQSAIAEEHLAI